MRTMGCRAEEERLAGDVQRSILPLNRRGEWLPAELEPWRWEDERVPFPWLLVPH